MPNHLPTPELLGPDPEPLTSERFERLMARLETTPAVVAELTRPVDDAEHALAA
jgi:hypothetical protein